MAGRDVLGGMRGRPFFENVSSVIALLIYVQYTARMQAFFQDSMYSVRMSEPSHLRKLRTKAGISVRELARRIDEQPTNVSYWERTGKLPRSDVLAPMAEALGVSVEDILGLPKTKNIRQPGGRAGEVFQAVSRLPRSQQKKILDVVEAFVVQTAE
jgi:transcriptional regulator with XRE-family HTH domain